MSQPPGAGISTDDLLSGVTHGAIGGAGGVLFGIVLQVVGSVSPTPLAILGLLPAIFGLAGGAAGFGHGSRILT